MRLAGGLQVTCGRLAAVKAPRRSGTSLAAAARPLGARHRRRPPVVASAAGEPGEPSPADATSSGDERPAWRRAVSLPVGLPTAGAVFFAAGALKLLIMCFPYSEMAIMMFIKGRADLGVAAALKSIPLALALAALAKALVDRRLHERRWVQAAVVVGGAAALWLSRLVFAQPKPSPLDPMFRRLNQERAAAAAQQAAGAQRQHMLRQPDAAVGRALAAQREAPGGR